MKLIVTLTFFLFTFSLAFTQSDIIAEEIESLQKPWTSLDANDENFQFVVITDRTGGMRPGIFETGVAKINLIQPEFVVSVGDLINGYTKDSLKLEKEWAEFMGFVDQFEMPFFYVAGNHDYTNEVMAKLWKEKFGTDRYHFLYKNVLFLCLNSEDGATALKNPDIGDEQLAYAKAVLAKYPEVKWTMVFMHQPLWIRQSAKNWRELEKTLDDRKHSVFTGHVHRFTLYERNKSDYFTLATMGGGSRLRGKKYGEFDHFMWVTMTDSGPYYANILLDGIEDKSIYTEGFLAKRQQMDANPPIKLLPAFQEEGVLDEVVFSVENPDTLTMIARLSFENGEYLEVEELEVEQEIPAKAKVEIIVPARMTASADIHAQALSAVVELSTDNFGWNKSYKVFPDQKYKLEQADKTIVVDGDLSDWSDWQYQFGEEDNKVHFSVLESASNLYVAVKVKDADNQTGFGKGLFEQDGLIISIDPRPISESAYNPRNQEDVMKGKWTALIGQPTEDSFGPDFVELLPEGVKGKGKRTKSGFQMEFVIPIASLEKMRGGKMTDMRFNVTVLDADKDKELVEYSWAPEWNKGYVGTGTFFRYRD